MSKVKVRFAPSPTGNLHVGTARHGELSSHGVRTAISCFGSMIPDTGSTPEFEASIRADLT